MRKLYLVVIAFFVATVMISCQSASDKTISDEISDDVKSVEPVDGDVTSDVEAFEESQPKNESSATSDEASEKEESESYASDESCDTESYDYAKQIYTEFLLNGGYEHALNLYIDYYDIVKLYTYMLDLNCDGGYELFIKTSYPNSGGNYALLGIQDGEVKVLAVAEDGGGTEGGSFLDYMYDSRNDKRVMVYRGNIRAGWTAQSGHFYVLSNDELYSGTEDQPVYFDKHDSSQFHLSYMADTIKEIKSLTTVYTEDEEYFYAYEINGVYVEKDEYVSSVKSYSSIKMDLYEGSLEEPIK